MSATELDPVVEKFVAALNANDRSSFFELLTDDATMSDDGSARDLVKWTDSEVFGSNGQLRVESVSGDGRELIADYTNTRWGSMRTKWRFVREGDKISRFETGQA